MAIYNQPLIDRYSDTIFPIRHIAKQQQNFNHTWNHINDDPNMANNTLSTPKEESSWQSTIIFLAQLRVQM